MIFVLYEKKQQKNKELEAVGLLEADGDQKLFFVSLLLLIVVVVELFFCLFVVVLLWPNHGACVGKLNELQVQYRGGEKDNEPFSTYSQAHSN